MDWLTILRDCGVRAETAARWAPAFARVIPHPGVFSAGAMELDDFMGQILHESGMLERLEEGLSYSAERLLAVWPRRFPTLAAARPYERNPRKLANFVYGGRLGNEQPDDGWVCRGSGLIQVTGLANLRALAGPMGWADPRALAEALRTDPEVALRASMLWWERNVPDAFMGDPGRVTKAVNGGTHGLDERRRLTARADGNGDGALG